MALWRKVSHTASEVDVAMRGARPADLTARLPRPVLTSTSTGRVHYMYE